MIDIHIGVSLLVKEAKMANVTGPTTRLPGDSRPAPAGVRCDYHEGRQATHRVTGETDSFGSEEMDMCEECFLAFQKGQEEALAKASYCDWCGTEQVGCLEMRDFEEGTHGPVYSVCPACRKKKAEYLLDYG